MRELFVGREIAYPFVLLDSSQQLRSNISTLKQFTRLQLKNQPMLRKEVFDRLQEESAKDDDYYHQILELKRANRISKVITMEALNKYATCRELDPVSLFGRYQIEGFDGITLWDEPIDFKLYCKAVDIITEAQCIIVDPAFTEISIGETLVSHIQPNSNLIFMGEGNCKMIKNFEDNSTICKFSVKDVIYYLHSIR